MEHTSVTELCIENKESEVVTMVSECLKTLTITIPTSDGLAYMSPSHKSSSGSVFELFHEC